jgi:RepB DNA-primase from phage plasmid
MTDQSRRPKQVGASEYLGDAFQPSEQLAVLIRNRPRGETIQRITTAARIAENSFQEWLHHKNDREGFDVYVGMNPLKPGAHSRTKDDILTIRHVYLDLDHEGPAALAAVRESNLVPQPNYVLSTSPAKFQVIWRVEGFTPENAEALLRAMARKFGADPAATDSTRVLRVPGFFNRKYEDDILVRAERHSERINHALDFRLRIDIADSPYQAVRRGQTRSTSSNARPLSQSEHDWAFAKRALARGTDPEEVIRNIAHFREGEKHDAFEYARRTVSKAQAELERSSSNTSTAQSPLERSQDY